MIQENGSIPVTVRGDEVRVEWSADPDAPSAMVTLPGLGEVTVREARRYARTIQQAASAAEDEHQFMGHR